MAVVDIIAPSGALGLVLGTIGPEGGPIVKDVKPESQLLGKVQAGDKIVAIDDVDVQTSKHSHVIQLLRNNSTSDERKITILRESQSQTTERWSSISRRTLAGFVGAAKSPRSRSTEPGSHEPDESGHPTTKQEISCHNTIDDDGDVNDCTNQLSNGLNLDQHIPTLPRFPVLETKDRNCWSEPSHTIFKIRGHNYVVDPKNKIQSGPYLFIARGADLILTNDKSGPRTGIAEKYSSILAGHARSIPTFIINFIFDWGILVNYYEIPAMYVAFLRARYEGSNQDLPAMDALQPHERAIIRFLVGSDNHRNATLKLIPKCPEGPWAVRQLVNGKPALIGKRLPAQYNYYPAKDGKSECFEADLDTRETDRVGKKAISLCRKYMTTVTLDVGIVIEGTTELPEQMLGCVRIHRLDPKMSPTLPSL